MNKLLDVIMAGAYFLGGRIFQFIVIFAGCGAIVLGLCALILYWNKIMKAARKVFVRSRQRAALAVCWAFYPDIYKKHQIEARRSNNEETKG